LEYFNSFTNQIPKLGALKQEHFIMLRYESFWILLNSACKTIIDDFAVLQFIHTIFVNAVVFWFFNKYTKYKFTSLFIYLLFYYLYYNTEILRESIAISFFLLAYPALTAGKWFKYFF